MAKKKASKEFLEYDENPITELINRIGSMEAVGKLINVSRQTICQWRSQAALPRTEWTGETNYYPILCAASGLPELYLKPIIRTSIDRIDRKVAIPKSVRELQRQRDEKLKYEKEQKEKLKKKRKKK